MPTVYLSPTSTFSTHADGKQAAELPSGSSASLLPVAPLVFGTDPVVHTASVPSSILSEPFYYLKLRGSIFLHWCKVHKTNPKSASVTDVLIEINCPVAP